MILCGITKKNTFKITLIVFSFCISNESFLHVIFLIAEPNPGPCPDGYLGPPHCKKALCYPNCMNGGNCTAPGVCSCPPGFQGPYCEGGTFKSK